MRTFLFIVLSLVFINSTSASQLTQQQVHGYLNSALNNLVVGNYDVLIDMFHFPPSYSSDELSKDKCGVKGTLKDMFDYTGSFRELTQLRDNARFSRYGVFGGDIPYWANHTESLTIVKETEFDKTGIGVLTIELVYINSVLELKSIKVGYYADGEGSSNKMKNLISYLESKEDQRKEDNICGVQELSS